MLLGGINRRLTTLGRYYDIQKFKSMAMVSQGVAFTPLRLRNGGQPNAIGRGEKARVQQISSKLNYLLVYLRAIQNQNTYYYIQHKSHIFELGRLKKKFKNTHVLNPSKVYIS